MEGDEKLIVQRNYDDKAIRLVEKCSVECHGEMFVTILSNGLAVM